MTYNTTYPRGVRVRGIIINPVKSEIALIRRIKGDKQYYVFPGGGLEDFDVDIGAGLEREIAEETGLHVNIIDTPYTLMVNGHALTYFSVCTPVGGLDLKFTGEEIQHQTENDRYIPVWLPIDQLQSNQIYPIEIRDLFLRDYTSESEPKYRHSIIEIGDFAQLKNA